MNTTTTESKRARRRTFKEVATTAYARGFAEGMEAATKNAREELDNLFRTNADLGFTVLELEKKLANVSLRKLAWSRITGLFGGRHE
jgi:flagellar biosynthesis/type III secretory pathway protein FliH